MLSKGRYSEWNRRQRKPSLPTTNPPMSWKPRKLSQLPINCVPRSQLHCHHFRSAPSIHQMDACSLVICFTTSPALTPTRWWRRKRLLRAPWLCDCESNCLVLTDLHNGGELPESCFGEVSPVSAAPHVVLVSMGQGSRQWSPVTPPV